ncbi:MAG TPA: hypothetical protein VK791_06370 [bacterium]|jgi:ABC-type transport system involved in multi-copper enzyme maturation permease subunit|nr:hypothetical protein [bacterium]
MNGTLIWLTIRQVRWIRFAYLVLLFVTGYFEFTNRGSLSVHSEAGMMVWILGAGTIGKDVTNGVLQSIFSRPVKRFEYVLSKWFAVGSMGVLVAWLYLGMGWTILFFQDRPADLTDLLTGLIIAVLASFGTSASLILFSSLVPGFGDIGLMFLIGIVPTVAVQFWHGGSQYWGYIGSEVVQNFLFPAGGWAEDGFDSVSLFAWVSYFFVITLCLTLAVWAMNRKEITYANS